MGLPLLNGCCGFRLPTGAAAISVVLIISSIVSLVFIATGVEYAYFDAMLQNVAGLSEEQASTGACLYSAYYGLMAVASLTMASILLHGIRKDRVGLMKAYLIWALVEICFACVILMVTLILCGHNSAAAEFITGLTSIQICVEAYLMWVIHSYRMTLKSDLGLKRMKLDEIE